MKSFLLFILFLVSFTSFAIDVIEHRDNEIIIAKDPKIQLEDQVYLFGDNPKKPLAIGKIVGCDANGCAVSILKKRKKAKLTDLLSARKKVKKIKSRAYGGFGGALGNAVLGGYEYSFLKNLYVGGFYGMLLTPVGGISTSGSYYGVKGTYNLFKMTKKITLAGFFEYGILSADLDFSGDVIALSWTEMGFGGQAEYLLTKKISALFAAGMFMHDVEAEVVEGELKYYIPFSGSMVSMLFGLNIKF